MDWSTPVPEFQHPDALTCAGGHLLRDEFDRVGLSDQSLWLGILAATQKGAAGHTRPDRVVQH
jgi:hypothetical protein